ncbi:MAG: ATP-binding protein [Clostridiales bacterium]|jgi:heavy metal sensor kinase|nr:ATP-binding protein [Eubacteriales bacterium]MDH7566688.1 ATP-binding protein [Clostridiales bacterium]
MGINLFKFTKISWKLTILYASIFSLVLILLNALVLYGIKLFLINQTIQKVNFTCDTIADSIKGSPGEKMSLDDPELIREVEFDPTINIRIANSEGVVVNSLNNFKWSAIQFTSEASSIRKIKENGLHIIVKNKEVLSDGKVTAYIQVAGNMEKEYLFLKILFIFMAGADLAGIAISLIVGYLISRRMLFPIDRITKAAQSISINNLDRRIEVSQTDDELSRLARTFNEMIDRLKLSFEKQNQFVSDASHELRTPISVIQGYIGLIDRWGKEDRNVLQESINAIKNETSGMTELIEKLLFLARGDSGYQKLQKSEFSLNELIDEVGRESRLISQEHSIQYGADEEISLFADRKMLKQMLRALIDNSIKFTPANGAIDIRAYKNKNTIMINIKDTGIGIPQEDINRIFNRFYRVDKARAKETGGSGLGLSIVKWIADAHNAKIKAESIVGEGTSITVEFPAK